MATWTENETTRDFLNLLFPHLERSKQGRQKLNFIANALTEQQSFPDLEGWNESRRMKEEAHRALSALKDYLSKKARESAAARSRAHARQQAQELRIQQARRQVDLATLSDQLSALASRQGTWEGGIAIQDWFYNLISYFELPHRRPYIVEGREIDGSVTIGDTTYLIALKFKMKPVGAPEVDVFRREIESKADNTMGIMVSMSDYTKPAKESASGEKSPVLLLGIHHLYLVLGGVLKADELVSRVRQHASQTGSAFLELDDLA